MQNTNERTRRKGKVTKGNGISGKSLDSWTHELNSFDKEIPWRRASSDSILIIWNHPCCFGTFRALLHLQNRWQSLDFRGKIKNIDGVKRKEKLGTQSTRWDASVEADFWFNWKNPPIAFRWMKSRGKRLQKISQSLSHFAVLGLSFLISTGPPKWFFTTKNLEVFHSEMAMGRSNAKGRFVSGYELAAERRKP